MKVKRTDESDEDIRTDGTGGMFSDGVVTEVTHRQRVTEVFYESIYEPFLVGWSDWRTKFGIIVIGLFVLMGVVAAVSSSEAWILEQITLVAEPISNQAPPREPPFQSWDYPLGTGPTGRSLWGGIVHATPTMLQMILAGAVFSTAMATIVGTFAGYKGGTTERVLMTITDILMTIPGLPLVVVLVVLVNPTNPMVIGIIITINAWAGLARTIHSQVLTLREHSYVEASRTMGIGTPTIIQKDILPNLMPYITVNFVNAARIVIYDSVALYFLGILPVIGMDNWGVMMDVGYQQGNALIVMDHAYMLIVPMAPVIIISLALILFAQGTDRMFNPRMRSRMKGETVAEDTDDDTEHDTISQMG